MPSCSAFPPKEENGESNSLQERLKSKAKEDCPSVVSAIPRVARVGPHYTTRYEERERKKEEIEIEIVKWYDPFRCIAHNFVGSFPSIVALIVRFAIRLA